VSARLGRAGAALSLTLLIAAQAAAAPPQPPAGGTAAKGAFPRQRAERVLRRAEGLAAGKGARRADLTAALMRLLRAYPALGEAGRARADALLARPTDRPDPAGNPWSAPEAAASPACTAHFCVHWVDTSEDAPSLRDANGISDGDGVPDYVELNQSAAEHVYAVENRRLGWRPPKPDGGRGGPGGATDIYISDIGGLGLFGYAAPDPGQTSAGHRFRRSLFAYLVMDDDYSRRQFPGTTQAGDLEVTLAHEYNHVLQFAYDAFQDLWMAESTAVWMEDQVYDDINDYLRYMRRWARRLTVPLTANSIKVYGSAVWNHWLQRRYGADLIRKAWAGALKARPATFSVAAYDRAIRKAGSSDFGLDFARFSADAVEWRTDTAFAEGSSYPDLARRGRLRFGSDMTRRLNHTTFIPLSIHPAAGRAIRLRAAVPHGTAAAIALVGRIGSERQGRTISRIDFSPGGGALSAVLARPRRFERITAVLINADTSQRGFSARKLDWRYTDNHIPFEVRATLLR